MSDRNKSIPPWLPYLGPYIAYLLLLMGGRELGVGPIAYPVTVAVVAASLIVFYRMGCYPEMDLRPSLLGIVAGVVGFAFWVSPEDALSWLPKLGEATEYDPSEAGDTWRTPALIARIAGATLVVPVFEELFLRSFLLRWFDAFKDNEDDFRKYTLGTYRVFSFVAVVVVMAITHHRWLRAAVYSAMLNLLLYKEKRMGFVIWAHTITNLLLGGWVVWQKQWYFW